MRTVLGRRNKKQGSIQKVRTIKIALSLLSTVDDLAQSWFGAMSLTQTL